jgi:hypothetical protein
VIANKVRGFISWWFGFSPSMVLSIVITA